jgi:hypothetical protein
MVSIVSLFVYKIKFLISSYLIARSEMKLSCRFLSYCCLSVVRFFSGFQYITGRRKEGKEREVSF